MIRVIRVKGGGPKVGPEGWGPRRVGAQKGGSQKGGGAKPRKSASRVGEGGGRSSGERVVLKKMDFASLFLFLFLFLFFLFLFLFLFQVIRVILVLPVLRGVRVVGVIRVIWGGGGASILEESVTAHKIMKLTQRELRNRKGDCTMRPRAKQEGEGGAISLSTSGKVWMCGTEAKQM